MIQINAVKRAQRAWRTTASCLVAAGLCLSAASTQAGHALFTFNDDPSGYLDVYGNATWMSDGGNPGGFLDLFEAVGSQSSTIIFDDFDNGTIVQGFTFTCDLKVGDGTDSPADGFSVNYAHGDDPVITAAAALTDKTQNPSGFASSPGAEANLPEEGTKTGLGIGFDSWDSGSGDIIGISVRVENVLKTQISLTTKNGSLTDWTSLQTGPKTSGNDGSLLGWAPLKVQLLTGGALNIWWKNHQVVTNYATGYQPGTGRLIFAGRTGGSYQRCYIDNIEITTIPASGPAVLSAAAAPQGVVVTMPDVGAITLQNSSVAVFVDGVPATVGIQKVGTTSYITGKTASPLLFGSSHTVITSWVDSNNNSGSSTNSVTVSGYPFYGFLDHNSSANFFVEAEDFNFGGGKFIDNPVHDGTIGDNSYVNQIGVSNIDEYNPTEGSAGHAYRAWDSGTGIGETVGTEACGDSPVRDAYTGATTTNYDVGWTDTGEWENYTRTFPAGKYRVYAHLATGNSGPFTEKLEMVLGDTTTTSQTTANFGTLPFDSTGGWQKYKSYPLTDGLGNEVILPISGKTTFRFTQVTGGANLDFFMFVPVENVGTLTPFVATLYPAPQATGVNRGVVIKATIANRETTLNASSIKLLVNGTDVTSAATIATNAVGASIDYRATSVLPKGATNVGNIIYKDSAGTSITNTWQFVTEDVDYPVLSASSAVSAGQITKSATGFSCYINQLEVTRPGSDANVLPAPLNELYSLFIQPETGVPYMNQASITDGLFTESGVINYNIVSTVDNPTAGTAGPFSPNAPFPGIPGMTDSKLNFVLEATTYLYLTAGPHTLAVSSDDGFMVTTGPDSRDALLVPVGIANLGRGNVESAFSFVAPADGYYPFRLVYWQGTGDGIVQFYSIEGNERYLVNDLKQTRSIKAYRTFTGTARPWVLFGSMQPNFDQGGSSTTGVDPRTVINAGFTNLGNNSVDLYVNGTKVTTTKTVTNNVTVVSYQPETFFPAGSTNTVAWVYAGITNSYQFTVTDFIILSADKAAVGTVDTTTSGFKARFVKSDIAGLENTVARMEAELAGTYTVNGTLVKNLAPDGPLTGGYYAVSNINYNIMSESGMTEQGNFTTTTGYPDVDWPAIPGNLDPTVTANYEDFAVEFLSYVYLPAGWTKLGVNSDDGFCCYYGQTYDTNSVLGVYDGGRGASDTLFLLYVEKAGYYPIRLAYEQGTGGGNCEFFSVDDSGTKTLINDLTSTAAIKAFYGFNSTAFTGKFTKIVKSGSNIVITYTSGTLQSAPAVTGPWTDVSGASSPYTTPNTGTKFFRLHQ